MAKFISFEGGDAAGKTTQLALLKRWLETQGETVVCTAEPDSSTLGRDIRKLMDGAGAHLLTARLQALLFMGARQQHIQRVIRPALQKGHWVLCDRFCDSTFVYQASAKGPNLAQLRAWHADLCGNFFPDMTILLILDIAQTLARLNARGVVRGFEARQRSWHQTIARRYARLAREEPQRFLCVDAQQSQQLTAQAIANNIAQRFMC